jgi:hypothetical protein
MGVTGGTAGTGCLCECSVALVKVDTAMPCVDDRTETRGNRGRRELIFGVEVVNSLRCANWHWCVEYVRRLGSWTKRRAPSPQVGSRVVTLTREQAMLWYSWCSLFDS